MRTKCSTLKGYIIKHTSLRGSLFDPQTSWSFKPDVLSLFQGTIPAQQGDGKSRLVGAAVWLQVVGVLLRKPTVEPPVQFLCCI